MAILLEVYVHSIMQKIFSVAPVDITLMVNNYRDKFCLQLPLLLGDSSRTISELGAL